LKKQIKYYCTGLVVVVGIVAGLLSIGGCHVGKRNSPGPYEFKDVGKAAHDILNADKHSALVVEIQYMDGNRLDDTTIAHISTFLEQVCNKPDGVSVSQSPIAAISPDTISLQQVKDIEKKYRTSYTSENTMVLYALVTNCYPDSSMIAAYSYYNTSMVIYGKVIRDDAARLGKVALETYLLKHEFGHLMGLVNMGTAMVAPHEDSEGVHHCNQPACVMSSKPVNVAPDSYCSYCINDLKANGGK
jgi:hypothetical protein